MTDIPPKMNSGMVKRTELHMACLESPEDFSPPKNKQLCLDSNNLNNILNNGPKTSTRWSYSADTSLVEPEILEDMGVGMLEREITNDEDINKSQSQECAISPAASDSNKRLKCETGSFEYQEEINTSSNLEAVNIERIEQDSYDIDIFGNIENESGYSSKVEIDHTDDQKENLVKENTSVSINNIHVNDFLLYRRKRKLSTMGQDEFNKLSDEIILMILKWLPKKSLVRCMLVCKRWCQIARDEVLWSRLDLSGKVLSRGALGYILPRGVQVLRMAQAEIADPIFCSGEIMNDSYVCKLQCLDLSMAVISPNSLAVLLSKCKHLKKLSLEKCVLNRPCCKAISQNKELKVLNLTMCEEIDNVCIKDLMQLRSLTTLSMAWCCLNNDCMTLLCKMLSSSITRLNIAGCRQTMNDNNVKSLSKRCPDIIELDLSDCALLTIDTVHTLFAFSKLEHLSVNRCYSIPHSGYVKLTQMPSLLYLDIFGLVSESILKTLQASCRKPEFNKFLYSSVARPTVGIRRTSIWGLRVRDSA